MAHGDCQILLRRAALAHADQERLVAGQVPHEDFGDVGRQEPDHLLCRGCRECRHCALHVPPLVLDNLPSQARGNRRLQAAGRRDGEHREAAGGQGERQEGSERRGPSQVLDRDEVSALGDVLLEARRLRRVPRARVLRVCAAERAPAPSGALPLGLDGHSTCGLQRGGYLPVLALSHRLARLFALCDSWGAELGALGERQVAHGVRRPVLGQVCAAEHRRAAPHPAGGARRHGPAHRGRACALPGPGSRRAGPDERGRLRDG
mmetsp:Transcript_40921/g.116998  ORF Transcript_40921/g.116998 Transcript_40921/m.116998 type:complete len:263 (+) Transcript_40921:290-1078(+)